MKSKKMKMVPIKCESNTINCQFVTKWLHNLDLHPTTSIFIMDTPNLIREFTGDEEVEYDFTEEGYLAKMKDRETRHPMLLVAADKHPDEDQVVLSVLHEVGHLKLKTNNEKKVEEWAYKQYRKSGGMLERK